MTTRFHAKNNVNLLPWPAASLVMNPIEHEKDEWGRRARSNQIDALNDSNMRLCYHYIRILNVLIQRYVNSMRVFC